MNDLAMGETPSPDTKRALCALPVFLETLERLSGEIVGTIDQIERRGLAQ